MEATSVWMERRRVGFLSEEKVKVKVSRSLVGTRLVGDLKMVASASVCVRVALLPCGPLLGG